MAETKTKKQSKETKNNMSVVSILGGNVNVSRGKGRKKPTRISSNDLRSLAVNNNLVRICINNIKHASVKTPYIVREINEEDEGKYDKEIEYIEDLLKTPNSNDDTFRSLFSKVVEDLLVLDMGVVEKVRNPKNWVTELYHVDGATIFPEIDEYGLFKDPAYYQHLGQMPDVENADAEFSETDLLVFQINPQGQIGRVGHGMSPVESIVNTVVTSLQAAIYNATYFDDTKLPTFIANLKGVPTDDLIAFRDTFMQSLRGQNWAGAFTNSEKLDFQLMRPSNQEMQFYELNLWLARIIFASFEVSPQDFGFTMDINRATGEVQERIMKTRGIMNVLDVIAEEINNDLIMDLAKEDERFSHIEFAWDNQDKLDEETQARIDQMQVTTGTRTVDELRMRDGFNPLDKEEPDETEVGNEEEVNKSYNEEKELKKWLELYK